MIGEDRLAGKDPIVNERRANRTHVRSVNAMPGLPQIGAMLAMIEISIARIEDPDMVKGSVITRRKGSMAAAPIAPVNVGKKPRKRRKAA